MRLARAHSLGKVQQCQRTLVQLLQFLSGIAGRVRVSTWRGGTTMARGYRNHVNLPHGDSSFVLLWFVHLVDHLVKQTTLLYQNMHRMFEFSILSFVSEIVNYF